MAQLALNTNYRILANKFLNSDIIALFNNTDPSIDGTPSWISSDFGNGKIVLFSTHPEIVDYTLGHTGKTIISNALFYTTSKIKTELTIAYSKTWKKN